MTATGGLEHRRDLIKIDIFKLEKSQETEDPELVRGPLIATGTGSYLEQIKYEGEDEVIWSINDDISRMIWNQEIEECMILPSDSTKRPDAHHIFNQEWQEAENAKHILEDRQRLDKR